VDDRRRYLSSAAKRGKDRSDYTLERTYRSLVPPTLQGGPYLSQEGDSFLVDEIDEMGRLIHGWRPVWTRGPRHAGLDNTIRCKTQEAEPEHLSSPLPERSSGSLLSHAARHLI
jgi:hypothetical protein